MGQFTNFLDDFSPGNKLAVAIVVCATHGCARITSAWAIAHVSYRYFIFEASVLGRFLFNHTIHKFPTSIILLPITKRAYFYTIILLLYEFHSYYFFEKEKQLNGKNYRLLKTSTTTFPHSQSLFKQQINRC